MPFGGIANILPKQAFRDTRRSVSDLGLHAIEVDTKKCIDEATRHHAVPIDIILGGTCMQ